MLSVYDYINIAFYFVFIVGVGIYFARQNKDTSDYFRGGGSVPWWITGASSWMAGFTAWTFTGAAGKIYETGSYVLVLYYQNIIPVVIVYFFTCYRFRRLRVVTPMEALRLRFGAATQQFYTWVRLPLTLIFNAFALNAVGIFMAAVFGLQVGEVLVTLGIIVTVLSLLGGALGVAASDFVQMFLIVNVATAVVVLALVHPDIGGFTGLFEKAPAAHFEWGEIARPEFIGLWFFALTLNTLFGQNSLSEERASKYMMAQSDSHARRMLVIPFLGTVFGPILWIVPPMAAAVFHPQLASMFPQLSNPNEAAFLAIARDLLPQGMLGLLICCIFAASITDMGGSLNWASGLLLRNFYLPVINPQCPEKRLVLLSRLGSAGLGGIVVLLALGINAYRQHAAASGQTGIGLFDLLNQIGVSLLMPLAIPACLGLFFKRTPSWSAWTTALIGLATSYVVRFWFKPEMVAWIPGLEGPYKPEETTQFYVFCTGVMVGGICTAWFFFSALFYRGTSPEYKASVEEFFNRVNTPLLQGPVTEERSDYRFATAIGRMCLIYGGFITLFAAIPNSLQGRLCYVGVGGVMFMAGWLLVRFHRQQTAAAPGTPISLPAA